MLWVEPKVKESFDKGKKVVTFFKSSTIGRNDLAKVQKELYDRTLTSVKQECPTRWSSYLVQAYRLSILIDKPTLFINSWLIRL